MDIVEQFDQLNPVREKYYSLLRQLQWELADWLNDRIDSLELDKEYTVLVPPYIQPGYQDCPDSPLDVCIYYELEDQAWDHCVICGEPHERK